MFMFVTWCLSSLPEVYVCYLMFVFVTWCLCLLPDAYVRYLMFMFVTWCRYVCYLMRMFVTWCLCLLPDAYVRYMMLMSVAWKNIRSIRHPRPSFGAIEIEDTEVRITHATLFLSLSHAHHQRYRGTMFFGSQRFCKTVNRKNHTQKPETVQMPLPPNTDTHVTRARHVTHTHTHTHVTHTNTGLVSTVIPCRFSNIIYSCTKTKIILYTHIYIHVSQDKGGWRGILWAHFPMHDSYETKDRPLLKLHARSAHCMIASASSPEMENTG